MHSPLVRRFTLIFTLALFLCLRAVTSESVGNCAIFSTIGATGTVTSTYLNSSFTTVGVTNFVTSCIDDNSASPTAMQATVAPFPSNAESLATSLQGELERLRYQIAAINGTQYWYHRSASYGWARGITAANNAGTPNTQFDLDADTVILGCPTCGHVVRINPGAALTNNVSTAGPAANGRDQAGAFTTDTFINFYWIWNGTTLATLSSATAPPTSIAATLPTGYTHWAYCCSVYFPSSALRRVRVRGAWVEHDVEVTPLSSGGATVSTSVSLTTVVPANALAYTVFVRSATITPDGGGIVNVSYELRTATGTAKLITPIALNGLSAGAITLGGGLVRLPNVGQEFFYLWNLVAGSAPSLTLTVTGYQVPNGE